MKTKKIVAASGCVAILAMLGYWGGRELFIRGYASTGLSVRPFVADRVDFYVSGGKDVVSAQSIVARRADGATATLETLYSPDGKPSYTARRVDLPNGLVSMVLDSIGAKSSGRKPSSALNAWKAGMENPPANCAFPDRTVDGEDTLFGYRAVREIRSDSKGIVRFVEWDLPDFSCEAVQVFMQKRPDPTSSWETTNGFRFISFTEADPDPRIFNGWGGYAEMKPSDVFAKLLAQRGITPQTCPKCFEGLAKSDANYVKWNASPLPGEN